MKSAKEIVKNKSLMRRLRNERMAKNALTRKRNMSRVGQRPTAKMLSLTKVSPKTKKSPKKKSASPKIAMKNPNNNFQKSIYVYKHLVAIPYAVSGLHNPRSPGYHDELVANLKNYQEHNPTLVPIHNKNWAIDQVKKNVYKVMNKNKIPIVVKPVSTTRHHKPLTTKKLLKERKSKQTRVVNPKKKLSPKKNTITNEWLKSITLNTLSQLRSQKSFNNVTMRDVRQALVKRTGRPELDTNSSLRKRVRAIVNRHMRTLPSHNVSMKQ